MFTGITEEIGTIQSVANNGISVLAKRVLEGTKIGDSIAVNGVCLTVTSLRKEGFSADVSPETLKVTALSKLSSGKSVNLERAMPANGRFGGHIVSGHIDGVAMVKRLNKDGDFYNLVLELKDSEIQYVAKKGSIAVNGVSLTVADVNRNVVKIAIIPHTFENTSFKTLQVGDTVNVETDILAKYVEKFLSTSDNNSGISLEFLEQNGF